MTADRATQAPAANPGSPLVVHVIVGLGTGGAEIMLERLVIASRARGDFRHAVVSLTGIGTVGQRLLEIGVDVRAIGMASALDAVAGFSRLRAVLRQLAPDLVQTWMYHADLLGGLAARSLGITRVIWGVRATFVAYEGSRLTNFLVRVCAALSRRVPAVIVCAAEASRRAHAAFGYDSTRLRVIPNGYDAARLAAATAGRAHSRAMIGIKNNDVMVGACGRFNPVKDFAAFVRAAAVVAAQMPSARFVLIGHGLDARNTELAEWLASCGVRDRFILLGERTDLPECLATLDIFCLSSKSEGFPNVVCEAMGAGVPCVVTNVGDAALIVGDTGEVVPREDTGALAEAILRMARLGDDARRALGERARARLECNFSIDAARARYESLYRELIGTEGTA